LTGYSLKQDVEDLQIMEEVTRGTFQAPGAPANTTYVAKHALMTINGNMNPLYADALGSEDVAAVLTQMKEVVLTLAYTPQTTEGIVFAKRGMNAIGGSPDPKTSFSSCFKLKIGTTQYYYKLKYCLVGSPYGNGGRIDLGFAAQGPWSISMPIYAQLQAFDTSAPTNWTFITPSTADPLMSADAGANLLTITDVDASTSYTPKCLGANITVMRKLALIPAGGTNDWTDAYPAGRRVLARYMLALDDTVNASIHNMVFNAKNTTSVLTIKSATHTATCTGGELVDIQLPFGGEVVDYTVGHAAETFALA